MTDTIPGSHSDMKTAASRAHNLGGAAISVTQRVAEFHQFGPLAAAAGAVVSSTGIGLAVTGGVLQVIGTVKNTRAAVSSHRHANGLRELQARAAGINHLCSGDDKEHQQILTDILPYTIKQKESKRNRRAVKAVPMIGLLESIRAVGKKAYKYCNGNLGKTRSENAMVLAKHLTAENFGCVLVQEMVAELFDQDAMAWIRDTCTPKVAAGLIATKLKST